jgi:hypothetical protein
MSDTVCTTNLPSVPIAAPQARTIARWICALSWCTMIAIAPVSAATLAAKAKESGCIGKPQLVEGEMYRCMTESGAAYFNVPGTRDSAPSGSGGRAGSSATPSGFPRVDGKTQRGRDDVRRKVLGEELATEEKLLDEARTAYANGAPAPFADERVNTKKYDERLAKLRQAVNLHEKNIEALRKELAATK